MFRVYKPRPVASKIRAVRVTKESAYELASLLMARVIRIGKGDEITGLSVPTFDGIKDFPVGSWILKNDENELSAMEAEEFEKTYEVARNTNGS